MRRPLWVATVGSTIAVCLVAGVGGIIGYRFGFLPGAAASLLAATLVAVTLITAVAVFAAISKPADVHDVFPEEGE
ncbi:hypothetical protein ACFXJ8_26270 [Nonomuraea sp. NPDC059194]|uniref:hypothetical protein n=1 Tax=Nonomuraea sp. NPDC059194 TaxID=3346764 RepID=UPI0036C2947B